MVVSPSLPKYEFAHSFDQSALHLETTVIIVINVFNGLAEKVSKFTGFYGTYF